MSKCGVTATQFKLYPGESLVVKGKVLPDCKEFEINLGKDCDNLVLHYNARFDCKGDVNTVVCNSRRDSTWEDEERPPDFPFHHDSEVEITFSFTDNGFRVKTEGSEEIVFPNRLGLNLIDYLGVDGDFRIKSVTFP
ncbi:16 kDa beta-galactoside-binding lectin-like [Thamnophis elegans]|uniref:16 kDa beta-galactoside-binding lectin-like n=1 Tax=Thamnophis elegans TaxID=35005 RepID=UPI001376BFBB|nr:16 kDa beta-galactoside-binding lectin-like [Thamnophis elegans]